MASVCRVALLLLVALRLCSFSLSLPAFDISKSVIYNATAPTMYVLPFRLIPSDLSVGGALPGRFVSSRFLLIGKRPLPSHRSSISQIIPSYC